MFELPLMHLDLFVDLRPVFGGCFTYFRANVTKALLSISSRLFFVSTVIPTPLVFRHRVIVGVHQHM